MTATARPRAGALLHEIDVNGRHTILTDEPERLGGTDLAPAPHELMGAMLAACASTMMATYARTRGWDVDGLEVHVEYDPEASPRQVRTTVHLPDHLTDDQVMRLRRVAQTCPAKRALEAGFTFDEQFLLDARTPAAAQPE